MLGWYGTPNTVGRVTHFQCGRNVTVACIGPSSRPEDVHNSYKRAVQADSYSADILRQYEVRRQLDQLSDLSVPSFPVDVSACPKAMLDDEALVLLSHWVKAAVFLTAFSRICVLGPSSDLHPRV